LPCTGRQERSWADQRFIGFYDLLASHDHDRLVIKRPAITLWRPWWSQSAHHSALDELSRSIASSGSGGAFDAASDRLIARISADLKFVNRLVLSIGSP
jgi:hypothetical protein